MKRQSEEQIKNWRKFAHPEIPDRSVNVNQFFIGALIFLAATAVLVIAWPNNVAQYFLEFHAYLFISITIKNLIGLTSWNILIKYLHYFD